MPRPPPPATALISTGQPILLPSVVISSSEPTGPGEPGTSGRPSSWAVCLATILSPIMAMCCGVGPMKVKPCASAASAKRAFSDRKP